MATSQSEPAGVLCAPPAASRRRAPRPKEEYITALKKGNYMLKYGRRGQPHKAHFVLSEDLQSLSWTSKRARGGSERKEISLRDVYAIEAGQGTEVFKRFPQHEHLKRLSFSVLYRTSTRGEKRSLDVVCSNEDEYDLWFTGLTYFHAVLARDGQQMSLPAAPVRPRPVVNQESQASTSMQAGEPSQEQRHVGNGSERRDWIGDVYIWGAPSRGMASDRAAQNESSEEGLQESRVPSLVHNTFKLDAAAVACGPRHAAMITKNGEAYSWGCGGAGRLGHGDCLPSTHPKMVMDLSGKGVVQMACGDHNTFAVTRDGHLYSWGDGTAGMLGHGTPHRLWAPKRVERPLQGVTISLVTSGTYHTAAVASNGNLYTWGHGLCGKLGHGSHETCLIPRRVEALAAWKVTHAAAGYLHTACVATSREAASLGLQQPQPRPSNGFDNGGDASALEERVTSCDMAPSSRANARRNRGPLGVVWTWGSGDEGCLGVGDDKGRLSPERVARSPESVRQVAAGLHFTLMLSTDGEVWQTGTTCRSGFDERSLPAWEGSDVPTRVEGALAGLTATQIAAGTQHAAVIAGPALGQASQMYTWGRGVEGQLGREAAGHDASLPHTSPNCPEPVLVKHLEGRKFVQVACGGCNTLAVVEHNAGRVSKDHETIKALDELMRKKAASPPGLRAGPTAGSAYSPSEGGHTVRSTMGGRRSHRGSMSLGNMARSVASSISISRTSKAGSDCASSVAGTGRAGPGSVHGAASVRSSGALGEPPGGIICPLTKEIFEDPVVAADGNTYERSAIITWLRTSNLSPMTDMPLEHLSLTPNNAMRCMAAEWRERRAKHALGAPALGRHRYAHSYGGSSQDSLSNCGLRQIGEAGAAASQRGDETNRSTPRSNTSPNMPSSRGFGSRL